MRKPKHELRTLGLFEGIGGIALGLERTGGFKHTAFCEIDPYCQAVLRKHWPDVPIHSDVRDLHAEPGEYEVLSGGFPCQSVSLAGKRKAQEDERWLWPEYARLVGEARPRYVLVENVRGLCSKGLDEVLADLAGMGYDAEWQVVSAAAAGAPHLRERILLVAYPVGLELRVEPGRSGGKDGEGSPLVGLNGEARSVAVPLGGGRVWRSRSESEEDWGPELADRCARKSGSWTVEPRVGRVAHGVPSRVDRLRALGNAVVPQVAEFVGGLILDHYERTADGRPE